MSDKNAIKPEGESAMTKEKPIEDTFAEIPDPDEIFAVMGELDAETIPEMLGLDPAPTPDEVTEDAPTEDEGETEPEVEGQIELTSLPMIEKEAPDEADEPPCEPGETVIDEEVPGAEAKAPEQLTMDIESEPEEERTVKRDERYDPKKPRKIDSVFEFVELFIFTFLAVMVISSFFFRHSEVVGSSMEKTLNDGDHLIISDFFYTPERGDIIVCSDYTTGLKRPIVKRVIGIAGDTVKIDNDGNVFLNGELLYEHYVYINTSFSAYTAGEWLVPEGEVFVMGDHRNVSEDSRSFGTVDVDAILGKVLFRFYPFDKFGAVE